MEEEMQIRYLSTNTLLVFSKKLKARLSAELTHLQLLRRPRHVARRRPGEGALSPACRLDLRGVAGGWPQDREFDRKTGSSRSSAEHNTGAEMVLSSPKPVLAVNYNVCKRYDISASSL